MVAVLAFSLAWSAYQTLNSDEYGNMRSMTQIVFLLLTRLVPMVVMSVLSARVIKAVKQSQKFQAINNMSSAQKRDLTVTKMLLTIIGVFVVCHTGNFLVLCYYTALRARLFQETYSMNAFAVYFTAFSNILLSLNSTYNLALYVGKDLQFRRILLSMVTCGMIKRKKIGFTEPKLEAPPQASPMHQGIRSRQMLILHLDVELSTR